jgi:hypothetical protein
MSLGYPVNKSTLDNQAATAALNLRTALNQCAIVNQWLLNIPVVVGGDTPGDPLVTDTDDFGYITAEADTLREFFAGWVAIVAANEALMAQGSEMTGLQFQ